MKKPKTLGGARADQARAIEKLITKAMAELEVWHMMDKPAERAYDSLKEARGVLVRYGCTAWTSPGDSVVRRALIEQARSEGKIK